jgi:hypothetical protein
MEMIQANCQTATEAPLHGEPSQAPFLSFRANVPARLPSSKRLPAHGTSDEKAGNTKWQDSAKLEMAQLDNYDTFKNYQEGHPMGTSKFECI